MARILALREKNYERRKIIMELHLLGENVSCCVLFTFRVTCQRRKTGKLNVMVAKHLSNTVYKVASWERKWLPLINTTMVCADWSSISYTILSSPPNFITNAADIYKVFLSFNLSRRCSWTKKFFDCINLKLIFFIAKLDIVGVQKLSQRKSYDSNFNRRVLTS